tara:strand:+ start:2620 stop:3567 length:948 start_codon:yes stop_codon:yes gene_type:complete
MKNTLIIFCTILLTLSCTKEVIIDIPGFEEQLVIDGRIETGQPPFILISKSKDIYAPTDLQAFFNSFVSGAQLTVSDGTTTYDLIEICSDNLPPGSEAIVASLLGVPVTDLTSIHICGYTSLDPSTFGQVGKTYTLTIINEGETFTGVTKILEPTPLSNLYWKPDGNLTTHGYAWATLSDPVNQFDAYKWEVQRINTDVNGDLLDANFVEPFSPIFDDQFFDGLTFDFFYDNPQAYEDGVLEDEAGLYTLGDTVVIKFSKMDKNVFEFMEKKYTQLSTAGNPFATPTNILNNLTGGALGVWAGYSPSFDTLICQP